MKAVNLIPSDAPQGSQRVSLGRIGPGYGAIGLLAVALVLVTVYVLSANSVTSRKTQLAGLRSQIAQVQAESNGLSSYTQFQKLAQARVQTVRQITQERFDWYAALSDLSRVVPANTSLQTVKGTVSTGVSVNSGGGGGGGGSGGGASTGTIRADINAPAFELSGCTKTQDDVARLMSRLRLVNGVQRVSLADSTKPQAVQGSGSSSKSSSSGSSGSSSGSSSGAPSCGSRAPGFDVVVFFQPLPGAVNSAAGAAK